jgi:hypothetical protein
MQLDDGHLEFSHVFSSEDTLTRIPKKAILDLHAVVKTPSGQEMKTLNITFSSMGAADEFDRVFKEWTTSHTQQS